MASTRYAREREAKEAARPAAGAPPPRPRRGLSVLTFLLALYGAAATTVLLARGAGTPTGSTGAPARGDLDEALAAQARQIRGEVKEDVEKAARASEERVARVVKQIEDARDAWKAAVESGVRRADDVVRNATARADEQDQKIEDAQRAAIEAQSGLDVLRLTVKEIQSRPVTTAAAPAAAGAPAARPGEPAPDRPPAPSATEPAPAAAVSKEAIREKIADLASPELKKVFPAAVFLGKAGDLEAVDPLAKVVREHKEAIARATAASALGVLKACDGVPTLLNAYLDKSPSVFLAAAQAFAQISGFDSGIAGDSRIRAREDAKTRASQFWTAHEGEIRERLGQAKHAGTPPPPEGNGGGK